MAEIGKSTGLSSLWPIPANHSVNKPGLKDQKSRKQQPHDQDPQQDKQQSDDGTGHNIDEYA